MNDHINPSEHTSSDATPSQADTTGVDTKGQADGTTTSESQLVSQIQVQPIDEPDDRPLSLSRGTGGVSNTRLEPWVTTFGRMCEFFSQRPPVGEKDGDYFVRGSAREDSPTRMDANIAPASLVVLDADSTFNPQTGEILQGAPDPHEVHSALSQLAFPHCLFTTYSHDPGGKGNRYRIAILAGSHDKGDLTGILEWIFHLLTERGCYLVNVKENRSWSQPWYLPRLASPESDYLCLHYDAGHPLDVATALAWYQREENQLPSPQLENAQNVARVRDPNSVFTRFNDLHGNPTWMLKMLLEHGYRLKGSSEINDNPSYRLLPPDSTTGNAGIMLFCAEDGVWSVYSHHGADEPLSRTGDGVATCDAWDLFRIFEHEDNEDQAIAAWEEAIDTRPVIKIRPGDIGPTLSAAVKALAGVEPPTVYQRAHLLCRIAHLQEVSETQGCSIPKGTAHIVTLHRSGLTVEASDAAKWKKLKKNGEWQVTDPCPKVIGALIEAVGKWPGIPALLGISEAPILRLDDSLLAEPGYDEATRLYVEGCFPGFSLPDEVDLERAQQAAQQLLTPFAEFPFVDKRLDEAVLLAYMLTLALRPQLNTAPLFCISATTPGSGKGLVIEAANRIVRGRDAATMPPVQGSSGEDETRKRITALLMQGVASINLDNWSKPIGGEAMNALLTASEWTDRVLGISATVSLPNRITLAATGNNLSVRGDMTRRALLMQLDPGVERPELREFTEKDLLGHIARQREVLLTALFTILKGYQQAGRPGSQDNPLGRFEQWCAAVCGAVRWLGFPDPLESQERLRAQDPEAEKLEMLLSSWHDVVGGAWKTAGGVIDATEENFKNLTSQAQRSTLRDGLVEAAPDGRGHINRNKLGWYLRHFTGRIVGGYRLEKKPRIGSKSKNPQQYRVTHISDAGGRE